MGEGCIVEFLLRKEANGQVPEEAGKWTVAFFLFTDELLDLPGDPVHWRWNPSLWNFLVLISANKKARGKLNYVYRSSFSLYLLFPWDNVNTLRQSTYSVPLYPQVELSSHLQLNTSQVTVSVRLQRSCAFYNSLASVKTTCRVTGGIPTLRRRHIASFFMLSHKNK